MSWVSIALHDHSQSGPNSFLPDPYPIYKGPLAPVFSRSIELLQDCFPLHCFDEGSWAWILFEEELPGPPIGYGCWSMCGQSTPSSMISCRSPGTYTCTGNFHRQWSRCALNGLRPLPGMHQPLRLLVSGLSPHTELCYISWGNGDGRKIWSDSWINTVQCPFAVKRHEAGGTCLKLQGTKYSCSVSLSFPVPFTMIKGQYFLVMPRFCVGYGSCCGFHLPLHGNSIC